MKGRSKIVSCLYVLPPIHEGEELSEAMLEVSENFNKISPGGKFSLEMIKGLKGLGVSNLWMLDRSEVRQGDDFMEWNCYCRLDILQLSSGIGQHSRAENMHMGFVWMRLPHPLLDSTLEGCAGPSCCRAHSVEVEAKNQPADIIRYNLCYVLPSRHVTRPAASDLPDPQSLLHAPLSRKAVSAPRP
jgi:hypothetical protein